MTLNSLETVRDVVVELPSATRLFDKLGIDYCCGGSRSLEEACARAGVPVKEVLYSLAQLKQAPPEAAARDWRTASLAELIAHILDQHHTFTRQELSRLDGLLVKVCAAHAPKHEELPRLHTLFRGLGQEINAHLLKEEETLFPFIIRLEKAVNQRQQLPMPPFRTVRNPVRMMMLEHDTAGDVLREMRRLSANYIVPPDGCASFQALYQGLRAFEQDLHQHIHLENNMLFPRAVELESAV
jgi:regulator of cell morphogenesis and NO signaling